MPRCLLLLAAFALSASPLLAAEYFVSPTGSDTNAGTDASAPLQTTTAANAKLAPGDTLTLLDGTYPAITITRSGTPDAWITVRAKKRRVPIISLAAGWHNGDTNGVSLFHVAYVKVIGLTVVGLAATDPTIVDAQHGIAILGSHHVLVQDCRVKDFCGGGIGGYDKYWDNGMKNGPLDFITIEGNEISGCAFWCKYLSSGISVCNAKDAGMGADPSSYNFVIRNNICHGNENKIGEFTKDIKNVATATDGNGIIIDYFSPNNHYPYNVLVEGNLCYDNGGRGIHVFNSNNVTVRYNTCWHNNRNKLAYSTEHDQGDLNCVFANHVVFQDNISVANPNAWGSALSMYGAKDVTLSHNLLFGPRSSALPENITEDGTLTADPEFVLPSADPAVANFQLKPGSPAIGATDSATAPAIDLLGTRRAQHQANDLGALVFAPVKEAARAHP